MPNDLRLRVGAVSETITFNGTDAQVAAVLERFARSVGVSTTGTPNEKARAILEFLKKNVRQRAQAIQVEDEQTRVVAEIQAKVDADNAI